nr:PEP-CTERM sorting domain-containing protein [Armatimonas rosea]
MTLPPVLTSAPEPSTLSLLAFAGVGALVFRRRLR